MSSTSTHEHTPKMSAGACICVLVFIILISCLITYMVRMLDTDTCYDNSPEFHVDSKGSINSLNVNGPQFTAEFNISVSVYNPTDYSRVYFDAVSAEIYYGGEGVVLNKTSLLSFTLDSKRTSVIHMTPSVNKSDDFGGVATGIALSRQNGRVVFGLIVSALFKYHNRWTHSDWTSLKVVCNPLKFAVSSNDYNTTTPGILLKGLICT